MSNYYRDRVLNGAEVVDRVYESRSFLGFRHTRPSYPVHIVVIPKAEIDNLLSLPDDPILVGEMMEALRAVSKQVVAEHGRCRVITNLGEYQESKHLHWHVIAGERISGD